MTESGPFLPVAETILIVEDDASLRRLAERILRKQAYHVIVAESGEAAVAAGREPAVRIDLLVTDVRMPNMSGPDVAAQLEAVRPGLKVLYVSGGDDSNGSPGHGPNFLQKPFSADALSRKVREILDR